MISIDRASATALSEGRDESAVPSRPTAGSLRVAVFSDAIPGRNGVGTYYDDLVVHLRAELGEVVMVSPPVDRDGTGFPRSIPMPGDPTQRIYLPEARTCRRAIKALSPHVIVSATPGPYGLLGMILAARTRAGLCVGFHTQFDRLAHLYWRKPFGRIFSWLMGLWDRLMFRRASVVVVHNEMLQEAVERHGIARVRLVGTPTAKAFIARPLSPLARSISSVAFIGRLAPEKQLEQVLEAAQALPHVQFYIAGDGPLRADVDSWAQAEPNIEALGWVGREQVLELLDRIQVLALPSSYETFGSIALEAMARGRLAVVSAQCGISRWPDLAKGLVVMEPTEPLVNALRRVSAMDVAARSERAQTARSAAEDLTRKTVADWLTVIREALPSEAHA